MNAGRLRWLTPALLLAIVLAAGAGQSQQDEKIYSIWGDPKVGREVYARSGCGKCHAINGVGATFGPDLGSPRGELQTIGQLAGTMWDHAPAMHRAAREKGLRWAELKGSEMRDLIAFLYFLRVQDRPGNVTRGRMLFDEKRCRTCHALGGEGGRFGPDLSRWKQLGSPILWVETMWSHAVQMEEKMRELGLAWPRFQGNEMVDLIAFIQAEATKPPPQQGGK